jgi:hypothetical protein
VDGLHFLEMLVALAELHFLAITARTKAVLIEGHRNHPQSRETPKTTGKVR